jgi:hypothetical protein
MANAEIYCKWSNQNDGNRGSAGWGGPYGRGAAGGGGGIVALRNHAERVAWKEAWPEIRQLVDDTIDNHEGHAFQVKIWLDQQVCPSCQKWMIIDVISHLKQLQHKYPKLRVELYAEVLRAGVTHRVRVQRSTLWPVNVGNKATYADLPVNYN